MSIPKMKSRTRKSLSADGPDLSRPGAMQPVQGLGAGLRRARENAGMALRELARRISVSPSMVSQIESGRVMPSVGTLFSIANELNLVIDDLFKNGGQPRVRRNGQTDTENGPVQRHKNRKVIRMASGVRWERLTAGPDPEVEFLYVVYEPGAASCPEDSLFQHGGKEYAYLLSGRLGVKVHFDEYELAPGDSISYDAQLPHRLWCMGSQPAVAIWSIVGRRGDKRLL